MRGLNTVSLIGNLGKEPDIQYLEGNIAVAKFSLATAEVFKDQQGQPKTNTEWHAIVLWKSLAQMAAKYLHKGSLVYLEGKLKTRRFEDKEGKVHFTTEIVANHLIMLDKRRDEPTEN